MDYVMANGMDILEAMIEGTKRNYNRSARDGKTAMNFLREEYENNLADLDSATQKQIRRNTKNSPLHCHLPIRLVMEHKHIGGKVCETHARVSLASKPYVVFDIPMQNWDRMCTKWERRCNADNRPTA